MLSLVKSTYLNVKYRVIDLFLSSVKKELYHNVLTKKNSYYRNLDEEHKNIFIIRTHLFIRTTTFIARNGFPVTLPMKILLSGAYVQVTYGLKEDALDYFNRIVIFPGPYSYKNTTQLFKGDVNPVTKTIHLSWPAVSHGFEDETDGINLAIHEFAHCLILENSRRSYLDRIFDEAVLNRWKRQAKVLLPGVRSGMVPLFRPYGGTNLMEMFAVALEVFFEKPDQFARQEPEFYKTMMILLHQDPRYTPNPVLP